ncbi:MAG: hypothetical protein WC530_00170 [Candidatus Omnitrophota bacterium]|jgi:hypothetical protein
MSKNKNFHFIVPVWGKDYTELFTDICLPMILTPGNLRALSRGTDDQPVILRTWAESPTNRDSGKSGFHEKKTGNRFVILTTWDDHLKIRDSRSFGQLEKLIQVEFILIDGFVDIGNSHFAMSKCYAKAMHRKSVSPGETYFVFLTPDSFWPDGTFRRLAELADQSFQVVMAGGLRVNAEPMACILHEIIEQCPDDPTIPMADLLSLALANIHQMSTSLNWLSGVGFLRNWPSHIYWINERDQQLIAHCFHLHPLMVLAPKNKTAIGETIDGKFLNNLHYPLDRYYVEQNEFIAIELSPTDRSWGCPLGAPSLGQTIRFALFHANSRHWHFFSKRITLRVDPHKQIDPLFERMIESVVRKIYGYRILAVIIWHLRIIPILDIAKRSTTIILQVPRRLLRAVFGG